MRKKKINMYAVYDAYGRKLSALLPYKRAHEAKKKIDSMSRVGFIQAIVAVPPFKVKQA